MKEPVTKFIIFSIFFFAGMFTNEFVDLKFNPTPEWVKKADHVNSIWQQESVDTYKMGGSAEPDSQGMCIQHVKTIIIQTYDPRIKNVDETTFTADEVYCLIKQTNKKYRHIVKAITNFCRKHDLKY